MLSLQDRYRGVLVGVLAGDATGAPYEKQWSTEAIVEDFAARGGLTLFDYDDPWGKDGRFPAGRPTDDSELTAVLAECLINQDDDEATYQRFRRCVVGKQSALCDLKAYGFGKTTLRSLEAPTYKDALVLQSVDMKPPFASNGSLMRTASVPLRYRGRDASIAGVAARAARFTHRHQQAVDCTVVYSHLLDQLLTGRTYEKAVAALTPALRLMTKDEEIHKVFTSPLERPTTTWKFDGSALYTLKVAHFVAATAKDFREGVTNAVAFSGDTDTYAAVAGGLLGAIYGIQGIPEEWQRILLGKDRMVYLADELLRLREADK